MPIEGAQQVRLMDVADVVENHQPLIGDALTNQGTSFLLVIEKFPGQQHSGGDAGSGKSTRGITTRSGRYRD